MNAPSLAARLGKKSIPEAEWYRLGDGWLGLRCDNGPLRHRFRTLFGDCAAARPHRDGAPRVRCLVQSSGAPALVLVTYLDPEPLDQMAFAAAVFPDRGLEELPSAVAGWRLLGSTERPGVPQLAVSQRRVLVSRRGPWQAFIGSLAVNRALRLQRRTLFFHAAAVGIGERGVLLIGPKGSGKTTLSLALASRGHAFLGDEIAGVRTDSLEVVAVRRAAAVRPGPRAEAVAAALRSRRHPVDRFPDGSSRARARVGRLFPNAAPRQVPLRHLIFLTGFSEPARAVSFVPQFAHVGMLSPLGCTLWGTRPAVRAMQMFTLMARVSCHRLAAGSPEESANLVERIAEEAWG